MKFIICNPMLLSQKTTDRHNTVCILLFKEKLPKKVQKKHATTPESIVGSFQVSVFLDLRI